MKIRTPLCVALITAVALAGCAPSDYQNAQRDRAKEGAIVGAALGAVFGLTRNGDDKLLKTAAGATVGALAGSAIGASLDRQAADLRAQVNNNAVQIVNTGSALVVTMPQDILFAVDSVAVRPDLRRDLGAVASNLISYPNSRIEVVGHTDSTGSASYNQDLSQRRAGAVANVLRDAGVPASRVIAYGQGEDEPIASNLSAEGRSLNRRVEIIIRPNA